ncbi:MAG: flagellar filament capping protein FliD [bacterium]
MSVNPLSNSGIEQLVTQYSTVEYNKAISPLETRKARFNTLSSTWEDLSSKLDSFRTILAELKVATSSSLFKSKKATLSTSDYFTASAGKTANAGNYSIRVNQLAKSDLLVSQSLAYTTDTYDVTDMTGKHTIKMKSGDYTSYVDVDFDDTENNQTLMQKLSTAINTDKAVVKSSTANQSNTFSGTGEFIVNLNGTKKTISYDFTNASYSDVANDLKTKIGDNTGITTEIDSTTGQLKLTVDDSAKYISIETSDDIAGIVSFMGINVTKEKAASAISTGSYFSPSTGNTKFSLTADNTGYDNRLILEDVSGNALGKLGLTSSILNSRTLITGDDSAGFVYSGNSTTDNQLNAKLNFNGINIQRNTNSITDLADGVTFALTSTMKDTVNPVDVTVANDDSTITNKIKDFIKQFNSVYSTIKYNSTTDSTTRGVFVGDATASSLLRNLTTTAIGKVNGVSDSQYSRLSRIGITFDPDSGLTLDNESLLTGSIADHGSDVEALFSSTDGVAAKLYSTVNNYVGSTGVIANIRNTYSSSLKYLTDKITSTQTRIDKNSENLRNKYYQMQQQYATMINNQNTLSSFMASS